MFQRLYELSAALPQSNELWEMLNEGMPPLYNQGFALCFDETGQWSRVETVQKTGKDIVYCAGPPNGTDLTPCCKLAKALASDSLPRLVKAINELAKYEAVTDSDKAWLLASLETYQAQQEVIHQAVNAAQSNAGLDPKTSRGFLYWAKENGNGAVFSWDASKRFMEEQFFIPLQKGGNRFGSCVVSGMAEQELFGNFSEIACYNLDKRGSIAGGFQEREAHRNFPVSKDAVVKIHNAFVFVSEHLCASMAGQAYIVLPYSNNPEIREELYLGLQENPARFSLSKVKDLVKDELAWLNEFENAGDQLALSLIFYEEKNASWRIQAEVQEVLPSRMRDLQNARQKITQAADLKTEKDGEEKSVNISAMTFKNFSSGSDKQSADTMRSWLAALFEHRSIEYRHFLHALTDKLLTTGRKNPGFLHYTLHQAWGFYRYALLTGLIQSPAKDRLMQTDIPNSPYGKYIQEHAEFFTTPEMVVAFLTGCYVSIVGNVQYKKRNASPFTKKFVGRLLSKKRLHDLYREGHDKLMQYDSIGLVVGGLDPDLAQAWINCGDKWTVSDEEATFAFTIGYSLQYRISQLYKTNSAETIEE